MPLRLPHALAVTVTTAAAAAALAAAPLAAQPPSAARVEFPAAGGSSPLSAYVRVGETIYLSGQLGTATGGQLAEGGIGPETKQALENMKGVLTRAGASVDDVVKCTVFLADIKDFASMNEAYSPFFAKHKPARSTVAVAGLVRNARVEIECIAVRGAGAP